MTHIQKLSDLPKVFGALLELTTERSANANIWRFGLLLFVLAFGYTLYMLTTVGHESFNTSSDGVIWGIVQAVYVAFVLASAGLSFVAALALVFGMEDFYPLAKRCMWLAVATLISGFAALGLEIGHPFRMVWSMPTGMQVHSPMFWMGIWYSTYMALLLLKFYRVNQGDWRGALSRVLGVGMFAAAVVAISTEALVFGMMNMRPLWYDGLMPAYVIATALLSGVSFAIFFAHLSYGFKPSAMPTAVRELLRDTLPKLFALTLGIEVVLVASRSVAGLWSNGDGLQLVHEHVRTTSFLVEAVGCLLLPFALMLSKRIRQSAPVQVFTSALVIVGLFLARYEFVVGGQRLPMFKGVAGKTLAPFYSPSSTEWAMALVGFALCCVVYAAGDKLFQLGAAPAVEHAGPQSVSDAARPASP